MNRRLSPDGCGVRLAQAFIFSSAARSKREKTRVAEKEQRRLHVPILERPVDEPPPFVVLVHGPPQARVGAASRSGRRPRR